MPRTHVVPTLLRLPESVLTVAGISLSVRQLLLLLLGCSLSYDLWLHLTPLSLSPAGQVARLLLALIPAMLALALAFVRIAGRAPELWLVVLARFWLRPKRLVWRSIRFQEPVSAFFLGEEEEHDA